MGELLRHEGAIQILNGFIFSNLKATHFDVTALFFKSLRFICSDSFEVDIGANFLCSGLGHLGI